MKKEILKQLRSDYEELEIKPSADLWDRIEQTDQNIHKKPDTSLKTPFQWWKYAAVILLLISFGGFFYFNSNEEIRSNTTIVTVNNSIKSPQKAAIKNNTVIADTEQSKITISLNTSDKNQLNETNEINEEKPFKITHESLVENSQIIAIKEKTTLNNLDKTLVIEDKNINHFSGTPMIAERKKVSYIKASELLETDPAFAEEQNDQRRFGVFDMRKIKSPNSLKILGMTIYSVDEK